VNKISAINLDMMDLQFIDSTGIGHILKIIYMAKEQDIPINITAINDEIYYVLKTIGIQSILEYIKE
jgi:anti-anti-sigma factor